MHKNIVGLILHERLRDIPNAFIFGLGGTPGVLDHVIAFAVLVFGSTEDLHAVVVGVLPVVVRLLAHLLGDSEFGTRSLGQFLAFLVGRETQPVVGIRTGVVG